MYFKKRIINVLLIMVMIFSVFNFMTESTMADVKSKIEADAGLFPTPDKLPKSMNIGDSKQIKIKNIKKAVKVVYKSNKPKIVKVSKKGKLTALKEGKANISISVKTNDGEKKFDYIIIVKKLEFKNEKDIIEKENIIDTPKETNALIRQIESEAENYFNPVTLMDHAGTKIKALVGKDYKHMKLYGVTDIKSEFSIDYLLFGTDKYNCLMAPLYPKKELPDGIRNHNMSIWIDGEKNPEFVIDLSNEKYDPVKEKYIEENFFSHFSEDNIPDKLEKNSVWLHYEISMMPEVIRGFQTPFSYYSDGKGSFSHIERGNYLGNEFVSKLWNKSSFDKGWHTGESIYNLKKIK